MDNVENVNDNSLKRNKITSLYGGMEILPGMRSENLYFKPIIYPENWDLCKGQSQMDIVNNCFLDIANAGTDDPRKLYNIMWTLEDWVDMDTFYGEKDHMYVGSSYDAICSMIYARILELGFCKAKFVTLYFISNNKNTLEPLAKYLIYNGSPVHLQMLPIASLYIELLYAIKNNEEEIYLEYNPNIRDFYRVHPQIVSAMIEEIKSAPLPTTNYFSWAFELASHNLEAQKKWILHSRYI